MKINEFVEFANNSKNKMLKPEQFKQVIAKELEVKDYIGIKEKKALIEDIINSCILYEDGIFKFDDVDKYIVFTMKIIAAYTNLELSYDMEDDYDALCEAKLLNMIIDTFIGEYENVNLLLQMKCDYILKGNNIESQIGKFLTEILNKLDDFPEAISNFDISKLPINGEYINKLMEFVNSHNR